MFIICRVLLSFFLSALFWASNSFGEPAKAYYRSFWQPYFHGQRLGYCALNCKKSGMAVANRYCKLMGYHHADHILIAYNVGLTHYIDAPAVCKGVKCNGFKTIRCVDYFEHKPAAEYYYQYKKFPFPRFNHQRLDWCYDGQNSCGYRAAFSFCRQMGFMDAAHYKIEREVALTQAIGNQKLCLGLQCRGFREISCRR